MIDELNGRIQNLQTARDFLVKAETAEANGAAPMRGTAVVPTGQVTLEATARRSMSPEARRKIGIASRRRWAEKRKAEAGKK